LKGRDSRDIPVRPSCQRNYFAASQLRQFAEGANQVRKTLDAVRISAVGDGR
jgi:hypothetical protein